MDMALEFVDGIRTKRCKKFKYGGGIGLHSADTHLLVIRLPDPRVLRVVARSLLLALFILSFPWLGSIIRQSMNSHRAIFEADHVSDSIHFEFSSLLFHDLRNEGLLKMGDKAVFVGHGNYEEAIYNSQRILSDIEMGMISNTDSERQNAVADDTFNFAFTHEMEAKEFIDRTLKIGGIVVVQLSNDPFTAFQRPSNYKIVYLRRFESTVVIAMRKIDYSNPNSTTHRRLCGFASEEKKAALKNLEDVLLEPPRASSRKSSRYLKKTRYLPDLLGDSLESYPRRVFIEVGLPEKDDDGGSDAVWFARNYPTRNLEFEMYKIKTVTEESSGKEVVPEIGMSDWLWKNVKEEEYVVMKAEAEVVEEMVKSKAIRLVDELFLDCKPRGLGGEKGHYNNGRRAYWECLALYGRLTDEGVAVHQWWG